MDIAHKRLPEYLGLRLEKAGLISAAQVKIALQDQIQYNHLELEEILSLRGWLKPETIDFFANKIGKLIKQSKKSSLLKCLKQSALLTDEDIKKLLAIQKETGIVCDALLVNLGYIKQSTIEFFKRYLVGDKTQLKTRPALKNYKKYNSASLKTTKLKPTLKKTVQNQDFFDPKTTSSLKISLPRQSFILSLRLNQAGLISESQIELALQDRIKYSNFTLEEILALRGWIEPETIDFFLEELPKLINGSAKISLAECLEKAGILNKEYITNLLKSQQETGKNFYTLVMELGTIKRATLDFFLNYIVEDEARDIYSQPFDRNKKINSRSNHWSEAETIIAPIPLVLLQKTDRANY